MVANDPTNNEASTTPASDEIVETPTSADASAPTLDASSPEPAAEPTAGTPEPAVTEAASAPEAATSAADPVPPVAEDSPEPGSAPAPEPSAAPEPEPTAAPEPEPTAAPEPEPAAPGAQEAAAAQLPGAEVAAPAAETTPAATAPPAVSETPATAAATPPAAPGAAPAIPPPASVPGAPAAAPALGGFTSGQIVSGAVTAVDKNEMEIDLGDGKVGLIGARHWTSGLIIDLTGEVKVGDTVEGAVLARSDAKQRIVLSRVWARQMTAWGLVEDAQKANSNITARVTSVVKGGLSLDANGLRGFMPASLVDAQTVSDLEPFVGQDLECRVVEADKTKGRLLLSRKAAVRAQARSQAKEALSSMEVGSEHDGKVVQITDFGAFVDVGGVRGLVHRSELGWRRFREPSEAVTVGQPVRVRVVKVQPAKNRLGLSMRLGADPLKTLTVGQRVEGTVSRLVDFGAFVQLEGGIEGLVHVSELAEYRVFQPEEVVMPGETVLVKVLKIDKRKRTVDLSIREALIPDLSPPAPVATDDAATEEAPTEDAVDESAEEPAAEAPAEEAAPEAADVAPAADEEE